MKTIQAKNFFKAVSKKQVAVNPALADRAGKKRPDCNWSFQGFVTAEDIQAASIEQVTYFLNAALEKYGKDLIIDNADNWEFVPAESDITLAAAYNYYNSDSSKARTLTKVTAGHFAEFYATHAPKLLGIPSAAAQAAKQVLVGYLTYSKKEDLRAALFIRLNQFADALVSDENTVIAEEFAGYEIPDSEVSLLDVLAALIKAFSPVAVETISADAL